MAKTDNVVALTEQLGLERNLRYRWRDAYLAKEVAGLRLQQFARSETVIVS